MVFQIFASAGIGRTGTFIAIDVLQKQYLQAKAQNVKPIQLNIFETVKALRKARAGMVQMAVQYRFIYQALNKFIQ